MPIAFVLVNCERNSKKKTKDELNNLLGVNSVENVFGAYDCVIKTEDMEDFKIRKLIQNGIRQLKNVRSTLTLDVAY